MAKDDNKIQQFINCKILRDHKIIQEDIWVRNGKIIDPEKVFYDEKVSSDYKIDCEGNIIAPGFIELQINGGYGFDFAFKDNSQEGIDMVSKKILQHGVTSYCPTLVTSPVEIYHEVLPRLSYRKGGPEGATILGAHVEGPFISKDKKGAHPEYCIRDYDDGISVLEEVYGSLENIKIITLAPEYKNSSSVIRELRKRNITVSLGHSTADLLTGESAVEDGANLMTHLFNAMLPFHHRDPGLVGLLASDKISEERNIFFGIISDGIHTHPAALRIAYRVHPKGLIIVTDAISAFGLNEGEHKIGQLDVEIRDNKAFVAGTNTLCGSIASMIDCVKNFMKATDCSMEYALEAASLHPAQVLGIDDKKGTLNYGADADFVMLSENLDIVSTWIAGECVYQENSK
ncbi:N-acetylglucosamine-6-phosphate deacetylase [Sitophilus oryzae]|uniref:N-acetylglucosamine-6-phosphate deacetylase n=1 Tax=Sitophilus oryzae TaxID=7048 RepID=A0A6J2X2U8_SITOR|nr:N-acetylglucosamine-6-phosphate deacetylase [Sitophilus oryzae]XP_030745529.1 N-acetylglucosamine-6-phosphate deacetylase [Sitophilus oryzae]